MIMSLIEEVTESDVRIEVPFGTNYLVRVMTNRMQTAHSASMRGQYTGDFIQVLMDKPNYTLAYPAMDLLTLFNCLSMELGTRIMVKDDLVITDLIRNEKSHIKVMNILFERWWDNVINVDNITWRKDILVYTPSYSTGSIVEAYLSVPGHNTKSVAL